jgi:hypothetical protein
VGLHAIGAKAGRSFLRLRLKSIAAVLLIVIGSGASAADRVFTSFAGAKPIVDEYRDRLPAGLRNADVTKWNGWIKQQDKTIRARLNQGDLDSMVNLLLFGTSFTKQPRIQMEHLTEASKAGVLRARVDDLVLGLRDPGGDERMLFLRRLFRDQGIDPDTPEGARDAGAFIYKNLLRVAQESKALAERAAKATPTTILDRASLFYDRGVSLDTGILPNFSIDRALQDLKERGVLGEGQVARVAVIGPGLDFIDKNSVSAFDYYPQQTLQPFALYDSLLRLGLANSQLSMSILDISLRVIDHVRRARERAAKGDGYVVQLPRDISRPWPPELIAYWGSLGDRVGTAVTPIRPPEILQSLHTRALQIRPDVVLACQLADLNIVLERLNLPTAERFDLMIGTNIFVYYDAFEQALALENAGAMLKPGGLLLTNDQLPEVPRGSMRQAGTTVVQFDERDASARDAVGWYRRQ